MCMGRSIWVSQSQPEINSLLFQHQLIKEKWSNYQLSNGLHLHEQSTSSAFQIVNLFQKGAL